MHPYTLWLLDAALPHMQARARKLRIFPDENHPFEKHPQLFQWEMPPRKLRPSKDFYELPDHEDYEPLNPVAYRKRFWHMMNAATAATHCGA